MEAEAINKAVIMMKKWLSVDNHNELCVMLDTTMITENPNISPRWTGETLNGIFQFSPAQMLQCVRLLAFGGYVHASIARLNVVLLHELSNLRSNLLVNHFGSQDH